MKHKFFDKYILKKLLKAHKLKKEKGIANDQIAINIWSRQSTIMENCVGLILMYIMEKALKKLLLVMKWLVKSLVNSHLLDCL